MSRFIKKAISVMLAITLIFTAAPLSGLIGIELPNFDIFSAKAVAAKYSGTCSYGLRWSLDTNTGALVISGNGEMKDWRQDSLPPWDYYKNYIKTVEICDGVTKIGDFAFYNHDFLESVIIGNTVTSIGNYAFNFCYVLKDINLPDSLIKIGEYAITCTEIAEITIPNKVTEIGDFAFEFNFNLEDVTIGNSVEIIGIGAFSGCNKIKTLEIPANVKYIGSLIDCEGLERVVVDIDNQCYSSDSNGVLFNKDKTNLIYYPCANKSESYIIPDSVEAIESASFYLCEYLKNLSIPEGVTYIEGYSIYYCYVLETVVLPSSIETINSYAFDGCDTITDVYYAGTEAMWNNVYKGKYTGNLLNAKMHYNSTGNDVISGKKIGVFSTEKSFTVEPGESMWLAFGLMENEALLNEWMPMAITVSNPTIVSLSEYEKTDYGYSLEVTGKKEGRTNLTVTDTETGLTTDIVVTVQDSYSKTASLPIEKINTFYPDNIWENDIKTNFYNINGLYMNNYSCTKLNGEYHVKFDIYNQKYHIGAVDIYDADGNWIGSKRIEKDTQMSSLYEWGELTLSLAFIGDRFAYTHPLNSEHTPISIKVPDGGYFVISNNFAQSIGCYLFNSCDIICQGVAFIADHAIAVNNITSKKLSEELMKKVDNNKATREMLYKLFISLEEETFTSITDSAINGDVEEAQASIIDLFENILNSLNIEFRTLVEISYGLGESFFEEFAGPAGTAMKVALAVSNTANTVGQLLNISKSYNAQSINVYSNIPEGFVTSNGTIVNTNGNVDTEAALQVFKIYNDKLGASLVGNNTVKDYDLYNICFVKNDTLVQPNGKVKVYMPIPETMKDSIIYRLEDDGSWTPLQTKKENNYLVFETDHFSVYAVVGEKAEMNIKTLPKKLTYNIGDILNTSGLSLEINGNSITSGFYCEPTVLYNIGKQKITVNYNGLTEEFEITVNAKAPQIITPSVTTVNYGDTLVLSIADIKLPAGCYVDWEISGSGFNKSISKDGKQCHLTSTSNGTVTVTVKIVDKNGDTVLNADGSELNSEINLKSNAGFFQKLISFFKNLFRISRIILQSV